MTMQRGRRARAIAFAAGIVIAATAPLASPVSTVAHAQSELTFFFAEGTIRPFFTTEVLNLANFSGADGEARVRYTFDKDPPLDRTYFVKAGQTTCVALSGPLPLQCQKESFALTLEGKDVSMKVVTPPRWVADRQMFFSRPSPDPNEWTGGHEQVGVSSASTLWYFAEGTTLRDFVEFITIQNPGDAAANVQIDYLVEGGPGLSCSNKSTSRSVPAQSRQTVTVNDDLGQVCNGVSAVVSSDLPVVVERPIYFNHKFSGNESPAPLPYNATDGHDVFGATAPLTDWYFAEGTTLSDFYEFLTLGNPNDAPAVVALDYVTSDNRTISKPVTVAPRARLTVDVWDGAKPGGLERAVEGVSVHVRADRPVLAERPIYTVRKFPNGQTEDFIVTGGHNAVGAPAPGKSFFFAGASTAPFNADFLTVQNSLESEARLLIDYIDRFGSVRSDVPHTVAARSRSTISLWRAETGGAGLNKDTLGIHVTSDTPVLVEQPSYFVLRSPENTIRDGAMNVAGYAPQSSPVASLGASPSAGTAPLAVTFSASASDADADVSGYRLSFGDGSPDSIGTGPGPWTVPHTYAAAGTYSATLTVTDSTGFTSTTMATVTVTPASPTAAFSALPTSGFAPLDVTFSTSASDPDSSFSWSLAFGDGSPNATGSGAPPASIPHLYAAEGTYTATFTVTDPGGLSDQKTAVISVLRNWSVSPASLPAALELHSTALGPDGRIYVMGGFSPDGLDVTSTVRAFSPFTGTWTPVAPLPGPRQSFAATMGSDGRIYAIGGLTASPPDPADATGTAFAYSAWTNSWTTVAPMPTARWGHAAAPGPDGRIYVVGGAGTDNLLTTTVLAYSPSTNSWSSVAPMPNPRGFLGAATGPDGLIYVTGGSSVAGFTNALRIYSPFTNTWSLGPSMPTARDALATVTGSDGRVYAIGGFGDSLETDTVSAYSPFTGTWTDIAPLPTARDFLAAAMGPDGRIYAMGGFDGFDDVTEVDTYLTVAGRNAWDPVAPMPAARWALSAATGTDGRIYAIGGLDAGFAATTTVATYSAFVGGWEEVAPLPAPRAAAAGATGTDGRIYLIGGLDENFDVTSTVSAYSPSTNTWALVAPLPAPRSQAAAATGPEGSIYVIGGYDAAGAATDTVSVYSPSGNTWSILPIGLSSGRAEVMATRGPDGRIYVAGGWEDLVTDYVNTVDVYSPFTGAWTTLPAPPDISVARGSTDAVLGPDGRIYVAGGWDGVMALAGAEAFSRFDNAWSTIPALPAGSRWSLAGARGPDGRVYFMGGADDIPVTQVFDAVEAYTP